jgi:hypothetical protein
MYGSVCKTDPTIVFSYTFAYTLLSMFTITPSTHSSFQGITPSTHSSFQGTGRALAHADACYEPTKYGTGRAYRMQATGARQVGTGRTEVPRSRAKYWADWAMGQ